MAAISALFVFEVFLIAVVIIATQLYMLYATMYLLLEGLSTLLKTSPPRRPLWLKAMGWFQSPLTRLMLKVGEQMSARQFEDEPDDKTRAFIDAAMRTSNDNAHAHDY